MVFQGKLIQIKATFIEVVKAAKRGHAFSDVVLSSDKNIRTKSYNSSRHSQMSLLSPGLIIKEEKKEKNVNFVC